MTRARAAVLAAIDGYADRVAQQQAEKLDDIEAHRRAENGHSCVLPKLWRSAHKREMAGIARLRRRYERGEP